MKKLVKLLFSKLGLKIEKLQTIQHWNDDKAFISLMRQIEGHTLVDPVRCYMLYQFALHTKTISGDIAEIGVYRGGTAKLISNVVAESGKTPSFRHL